MPNEPPLVGIIMGSASDWPVVQHAALTLKELGVPHEARVMSAHRTPHLVQEYCAGAADRGLKVMICAAGGAAHLAGVASAYTYLPVLGIPMQAWSLDGLDSLLSMAQMPRGVPVGTLAVGKAGAVNAALLAVAILALSDPALAARYAAYREAAAEEIEKTTLPPV